MTDTFDTRLDQVERALKIINGIENNPDLQSRTFDLLFGDPPAAPKPPAQRQKPADTDDTGEHSTGGNGGGKGRSSGKRTSKAAGVSVDKNVDTAPKGVMSWKDFAAEKKPSNNNDRNTAAVYWLKEVAGNAKANAGQVLALFIDAGWKPATDPRNSLQVTASAVGLLNTADMDDIIVTPRGIGRIRNDLPAEPKKR